MKAAIVTIGNELLQGFVVDTNAAWLGKELLSLGVEVVEHLSVGDEEEAIRKAVLAGLAEADLVIATGGLGPTSDDVTRPVVAGIFDATLVRDKRVLKDIQSRFKARGLRMPAINRDQALVPYPGRFFPNPVGSAPGLVFEKSGKTCILLPGVPWEMKVLFEQEVQGFVRKWARGSCILTKTLRTTGITESALAERIVPLARRWPIGTLAYLPSTSGVDLRVKAEGSTRRKAQKRVESYARNLAKAVEPYLYGTGEETLEGAVGRLLHENRKTVAVAESCTGGLIGDRLTNIPGSSAYYLGGAIAYSNLLKHRLLGVSNLILRKCGAVSEECARQMAKGVRDLCGADFGLAVTGIAGPGAGSEKKPVGLIYISLANGRKVRVEKHHFLNTRREIKERTAQAALNLFRKELLKS
jgi:nicotinamide-nucleotide amidase